MEVEMLGRQIGEDGDVHLHAAQLTQRERVTGRFEHAPRAARDEQLCEELLHLDRLLRALSGLVLPDVIALLEIDGRRESSDLARGIEHVGDEVHRRGLPVGSGDPDELQLPGRMVEELGGEICQSGARVRNDGHGHPRLQRVLRDDGDGPARDRIAGERVPIAVEARDGETVVFSWIEWPSKQVRDEAWPKLMAGPRMQPDKDKMPFDGQRMIYGGFATLLDA